MTKVDDRPRQGIKRAHNSSSKRDAKGLAVMEGANIPGRERTGTMEGKRRGEKRKKQDLRSFSYSPSLSPKVWAPLLRVKGICEMGQEGRKEGAGWFPFKKLIGRRTPKSVEEERDLMHPSTQLAISS